MNHRIVIVAPHFAEYSERMAAALAATAPTVLLTNALNRAEQISRPIASAARIIEMPMNRRADQARAFLASLRAVFALRADLVIIQEGVRQFLKPLIWLLRRFTRVALIVHDPAPHSGTDANISQGAYRRWLRENADLLIVHGAYCREALLALGYPAARVITINHGVLMEPARLDASAGEPGRVLMFGRMEAYKGLEQLLDAAQLLHTRGLGFQLVIAGAGPEQARLGARMAGMVEAGVRMEVIDRYLEPDALEHELARASFVVAPYLDATQSGVLASTFANGRPIVATAVGGLGDVVHDGENGRLVPPRDPAALAEAMAALLTDPSLAMRLGEGARRSARTALDWGCITSDLLAQVDQKPAPRRRFCAPRGTAALLAVAGLAALLPAASEQARGSAPKAAAASLRVFDAPPCDAAAPAPSTQRREPPVRDMYGTSEIEPDGARTASGIQMSWAKHPRLAYGNSPPPTWTSMLAWGQVFISVQKNRATNTRVEVRDLRLFLRPRTTGRWCLAQMIQSPIGGLFRSDFVDDNHLPGSPRSEPDGGRSFALQEERFVHFFANARIAIPAGGVTGVYADFAARKVLTDPTGPDDRAQASLVASAGADYWASAQAPSGHNGVLNADAGIGRFREVGNSWKVYSMNTAAPGAIEKWKVPPPPGTDR